MSLRTNVALWLLATWVLLAMIGPAFPLDPNIVELERMFATPIEAPPFGRDELGRPLLDRLILGARLSCFVAFTVVAISAAIGIPIGLAAGYFGGWLDRSVVAVIDIFLAFPGILLAIALAAILGPGLDNLVVALSAMGWVGFARLARVQAQSLRGSEHVQAALSAGVSHHVVLHRHILRLSAAPLLVEASFSVASVVIAEAGLSFLGLGVQPPQPSWGGMIQEGVRYLLVAPHLVLAPGLAICVIVLAANRLGDELRDALDVRFSARNRP